MDENLILEEEQNVSEETPVTYNDLVLNLDGSYTFTKNGFPYNCPNSGEWADEFAQVDAYAKEHPEEVSVQQPVVITLEELKQNKLSELDASFNDRVNGFITTSQGYKMQFQPEDSLKMQGSILVLESMNIPTGYLTQYNDVTIHDVSIETMKDVMMQMMRGYAVCHEYKQNIRALINSAESEEDLNNIAIEWPV